MKFRQTKLSTGKDDKRHKKTVTFSDCVQTRQHDRTPPLIGSHSATTPVIGCHVGISQYPDQVRRRILKKPFSFHLLVVGEKGVGKSSLIKTLFHDLDTDKKDTLIDKDKHFETSKVVIPGDVIDINYVITEAPGFGDINSDDVFNAIENYVENNLDDYFERELSFNRNDISDTRVDGCLFFLNHTGHGVKNRDMELLKRLHKLVTIIPIIAKADTCTKQEVDIFKQQVNLQS